MKLDIRIGISFFLLLAAMSQAIPPLKDPDSLDSGASLDPNDDAFYNPPRDLEPYKPGNLIRSRPVLTIIAPGLVKAAHQVLYRTTDTSNHSQATVATLWEPLHPRSPPQLLSYHADMDSDSFDCSLSWAWINNSASKEKDVVNRDPKKMVEWALSQGIHVVNPDHEGAKAIFFAGFQAGQAALDGMRAARLFFRFPTNVPIGMTGYSGGGQVTAWAANLADRYAPDLNIIGEAHGGTPIDARNIISNLDGSLFSSFATAGLIGLMEAYPKLKKFVYKHIDDTQAVNLKKYQAPNHCRDSNYFDNVFDNFPKHINVTSPLDTPIFKTVLQRESLLMNVSSVGVGVPKFPRYIYHANLDQIASLEDEELYIQQQCRKGANIQFHILHFAEHITAKFEGLPGAIQFLGQVFNGTTPKVECGTDSRNAPASAPSTIDSGC